MHFWRNAEIALNALIVFACVRQGEVMKVLVIVSSLLPGGAERVSLAICERLAMKGWEVHLLVSRLNKKTPAVYPVPDGVHLHACRIFSEFRPTRFFGNYLLLSFLMKKIKPNCVVSLGAQYKLIEQVGILGKEKTVLSERNWPRSEYGSQDEFDVAARRFEKADAVVFQTAEARNCFSEYHINRAVVIPNAAPNFDYEWVGGESKRIALVGRLFPQKNISMAIRSFYLFSMRHPGYVLDIYGEGPLLEELQQLSSSLGISDSVVFNGKSKRIYEALESCCLYISTSDFEGISNALLEAMSIGVPCVCTDCDGGGARLLIRDGFNGSLVSCGDEEGFARAMEEVLMSGEKMQTYSANAKQVKKEMSEDAIYGKWEALISEIAAAK